MLGCTPHGSGIEQPQVKVASVVPTPNPTEAPPAPDAFEALLSGTCAPDDASIWSLIGPSALQKLQAVANDPAVPMERRTRAVAAMAWVPDKAAVSLLRAMVFVPDGGPGEASGLRAEATLALIRRLGPGGVMELQSLLADQDPLVREAAARGLGIVGGADAQSALEARIEQEPSPAVRERIQQSLTQLQP